MYNTIDSFWQKEYYLSHYDVLIVGGGFTGLTTGIELLLSKPKLKVGLIENETHGTLASSRNAGFMCYGSPTELLADIQKYGEHDISELLKQKQIGYTTLIKHLAGNKGIYKKSTGYELFNRNTQESTMQNVLKELSQLNSNFENSIKISNYYSFLPSFHGNEAFSAIKFKLEGQLQPTAAVVALSKKFMNLGGILHLGTTIQNWTKKADGFVLESNLGSDFHTKQLVITTNAFASQLLPDMVVTPQRAQVLVTAPLKVLPYKGNFHMNEGYIYFRNIGNRLLLGGLRNTDFETEQTDKLGLNAKIQENLTSLLHSLLPKETPEITHRWSGIMGFQQNQIPALKIHQSGILVAAGMNGMGTLLGPALGKQAANAVLRNH